MKDLYRKSATECVALLKSGDIKPDELIDCAEQRIESIDADINALPIRCFERAREQAKSVRTDSTLAGLPIAVKDYNNVGGVVTTFGSTIFRDYVPATSDYTVATLERNGAIPIAKSNVPEWAGGHTFNPVFGTTCNPWNLARSAGGSSGGSAAALAAGMVWLATGNDLGGSLRTPAGFNGVVGLRPGPGRVPRGKRLQAFDSLWVEGPMARNVADIALMLDAGCGFHPGDPLSFDAPAAPFTAQLHCEPKQLRVAFSRDLGIVPMEPEIADICQAATARLAVLGADVTTEIPDFSGALDSFQTLRAVLVATMMGELYEQHRDAIAPEIIGNIERGLNISASEVFAAERYRWQLYGQLEQFFLHHDLLICPAASIEPFPIEQRYVEVIDGKACETYIDWFAITFALSLTGCPVLSLPCGHTANGLPVGIQIMGKPRGEAQLLAAAAALEAELGLANRLPIDPQR
jgi:amidase